VTKKFTFDDCEGCDEDDDCVEIKYNNILINWNNHLKDITKADNKLLKRRKNTNAIFEVDLSFTK
jgi:hypothetical protein